MPASKLSKFIFVIAITVARIPLSIAFAMVLLLAGSQRLDYIACNVIFAEICIALLVLGELTDFFDGMLARKLNVVSEAGAMLDPYADSISRIIIYWALACSGLVTPLVPLAMAFRDVTVSYSRIILGKAGKSVSAKMSGKIKAAVQGFGCVILFLQPVFWHWGLGKWSIHAGSWIIIVVTIWSMIDYVKAAILTVKEIENSLLSD